MLNVALCAGVSCALTTVLINHQKFKNEFKACCMSEIPLSMMRPVTGGNKGRGGDYREVTKLIDGLSSDSEQEQFSLPPLELRGSGRSKR